MNIMNIFEKSSIINLAFWDVYLGLLSKIWDLACVSDFLEDINI